MHIVEEPPEELTGIDRQRWLKAARQRRYRSKMATRGLKEIIVTVPKRYVDYVKDMCARMVEEHKSIRSK